MLQRLHHRLCLLAAIVLPFAAVGEPIVGLHSISLAQETDRPLPKLKVQSRLVRAETDAQLVSRAFQQLAGNAAEAARIARKRLQDSKPLSAKHQAVLLWVAGSALSIRGQHLESMQYLEESECMAVGLGDQKLLRRVLRYIAASAFELSQYRRARDAAAEALRISAAMDDTSGYVGILYNEYASSASRLGEYDAAVENYQAALRIARESRNTRLEAMVVANLANLYADHDQHEAAVRMCRRSLASAIELDLPLVAAVARLNLAGSLLNGGYTEEARDNFQEVLNLKDSSEYEALKAGAHQGLGDIFLQFGDPVRSRHHLERALESWTRLNNPGGRLATEQQLVQLDQAQGRHAEARQKLEKSLDEARQLKEPQLILRLLEQLISLHAESGDWHQAFELMEESQALQKQVWQMSATRELATLQADMQLMEQTQTNAMLSYQVELQQARLTDQRHLTIMLSTGLSLLGLFMVFLFRTLKQKRRIIRELVTAEAEIRRQKQVQLTMERRIAEQQRAESLSVMAAGIAHDFNNLLTIIAGLCELGQFTTETQKKNELLGQISTAAFQAADLTAQLRQFIGRSDAQMKITELGSTIESARGLLTSMVRSRSVLEIVPSPAPLLVSIPDGQLQQMLINLVSNSADAMSGQGTIRISTGRRTLTAEQLSHMRCGDNALPADYCYFRVADTGTGISPAVHSRIFDPYFSTKSSGRGLGLASVLGIVRSCHGAIEIRSVTAMEAESGPTGTTLTVYLPAASAESLPAAALPADAARRLTVETEHRNDADRRLVLLVDDEMRVVRFVSRILETSGYVVLTASNADTALQLVRQHGEELCCVVSDYTMPGEDGVAAQQIRDVAPELPVIICSGYGPEQMPEKENVAAFLQKPYVPQDLLRLIERLRRPERVHSEGG